MDQSLESYRGRVLVVDDEQIARDVIADLLERDGYELHFAERGGQGLEVAREILPDVILLDVMMPDMDGFEVCARLREDDKLKLVPVVFITALDDRASQRRGLEAGADDYLNKPFLPMEMRGKVRNIVRLNRYRTLLETSEKLALLANYDHVTGLPNRALFIELLNKSVSWTATLGETIAVVFIEIGGLKEIGQTLGGNVREQVETVLVGRFQAHLDASQTLGKVSGNEFAVMTGFLAEPESHSALRIINELRIQAREPMTVEGHELSLSANIGAAFYPTDANGAETLLNHADTAASRARAEGKNQYQFYLPEMNRHMLKHLLFENQLRKSFQRDELVVYYQPQVDLATGRAVGVEALLRWNHPELGLLLPDAFIPVAEESGCIVELGAWVLEEACRQGKRWLDDGRRVHVAVNFSSRQFQEVTLVPMVEEILCKTALPPAWLELELTESLVLNPRFSAVNPREQLQALKEMGISIALDDFGTGYSALGYLKRYPFDRLKIDRSFIQDIPNDGDSTALVKAIIAMSQALGLKTIAEGVETEAQARFLIGLQCDWAQGYRYGPPLPASQVVSAMEKVSVP